MKKKQDYVFFTPEVDEFFEMLFAATLCLFGVYVGFHVLRWWIGF